jgi:hypothetical protein
LGVALLQVAALDKLLKERTAQLTEANDKVCQWLSYLALPAIKSCKRLAVASG